MSAKTVFGRRGHSSGASHEPAQDDRTRDSRRRSPCELMYAGGRIVLWAFLAVVLVRGLGSILSGPAQPTAVPGPAVERPGFPGTEAEAFAVRFARAYLTWSPGRGAERERAVAPYLSSGLRDRAAATLPRRGPGERVAQATVARESSLGGARALVTVACSFPDATTRYLTVPVARDRAGGLVVSDLPSLSAPPQVADVAAPEAQPLTGAQGGAMSDVVRRFLASYVGGGGPGDLAYFVAPGAWVTPMPDGLELASVEQIDQAGPITAAGVPVIASVRVRDRASGAIYPLRYRLQLVRRDRWYVAALGGAA